MGSRKTIFSFRGAGNMRDELDLRLHGNGENMKQVNRSLSRFFCRTVGLLVLFALLGVQSYGDLVGRAHASVDSFKCEGIFRPKQVSDSFRSLSIGMYHSLLVKNDGSLWAWGSNSYGELGDGTQTDQRQAVPKQIGKGFRSVVAGSFFSLAVKEDGTLWSWGKNDSGQLGEGTKINRSSPQQIGSGFRSVAAGWGHSLGLKEDGSLWVWGSNAYGVLGIGSTDERTSPTQIAGVYKAVAAARNNSVALGKDGSLWAWGRRRHVEHTTDGTVTKDDSVLFPIKIGADFQAVAVNVFRGLGLKNDGSLWTWRSDYVKGFDGRIEANAFTPEKIRKGLVVKTAARERNFALDGADMDRFTPVKINDGFTAVATGGGNSFALSRDGRVWAWGRNSCGQLGFEGFEETSFYDDDPFRVPEFDDVVAIFAEDYLSLAIKKDGTVWVWGGAHVIKQLEAALADGAKSDDQETPSTAR